MQSNTSLICGLSHAVGVGLQSVSGVAMLCAPLSLAIFRPSAHVRWALR